MFKWLAIFSALFVALWMFFIEFVPNTVRNTIFASNITATLCPIDFFVKKQLPQYNHPLSYSKFKPLDGTMLVKLMKHQESFEKPFVFAVFDLDSFGERISFNFLKKYLTDKKNVTSIMAITSNNPEKSMHYLRSLENNNLQYLLVARNEIAQIRTHLISNGMNFSQTPSIYFYSARKRGYSEIATGYYCASRIETLLNQD